MKVTAVHLGLFYLLLCEGSTLADMAKRREMHPVQDDTLPTATSASPLSTQSHNPATVATPITTALPTQKIPLYIPDFGPSNQAKAVKVDYLGPANGGSTVYQVIMTPKATAAPVVTATLVEDATNAELLGGQRVMTIDGQEQDVYAAASCGFADGLQSKRHSKSAGYCVYWYVKDHATSTWASAVTDISAQTSIVPSSQARAPAPTEIADDALHSTNPAQRITAYSGFTAAATVLALIIHLLQPWAR